MKNKLLKIPLLLICLLIFSVNCFPQSGGIPSPKLVFEGTEEVENGQITRVIYWLSVENRTDLPNEMFESAPDLPPCGKNTDSSRSWIDVFDNSEKRLYGFCAVKNTSELNKLSFSLPKGKKPPKFVYIVITDRKTKKKYSSNLAQIKIDNN